MGIVFGPPVEPDMNPGHPQAAGAHPQGPVIELTAHCIGDGTPQGPCITGRRVAEKGAQMR